MAEAQPRTMFRRWRRQRPFWAGVLTMAAGVELLAIPAMPLTLLILPSLGGFLGLLLGALITTMGLFLWFTPEQHTLVGVITVILSLASFVSTNLGGLLVGMLLGVIGGSLAFAWTPEALPVAMRDAGAIRAG